MQKLKAKYVSSLIKKRERSSHKGSFGHVLVVAGSKGMVGAAVLCANAALKSGAGLVSAAVPENIYCIAAKQIMPEAMVFSYKRIADILSYIVKKNISTVVIGPGIGATKASFKMVSGILNKFSGTAVVDADALNSISKFSDPEKFFKNISAQVIITPHPGELSRLIGLSTKSINKNRIKTSKDTSFKFGVVCVLKGSGTVVSDGNNNSVNTTGNPGMAKGGSGDVLSGIIGSLVSQVKSPQMFNAAAAGVFIHGLAGDIAAKSKTQISMTATDIIDRLHMAFQKIKGRS